jgi:hypothetical protein
MEDYTYFDSQDCSAHRRDAPPRLSKLNGLTCVAEQLLAKQRGSERLLYSTYCDATTAMVQLRVVLMHVTECAFISSLCQPQEMEST